MGIRGPNLGSSSKNKSNIIMNFNKAKIRRLGIITSKLRNINKL